MLLPDLWNHILHERSHATPFYSCCSQLLTLFLMRQQYTIVRLCSVRQRAKIVWQPKWWASKRTHNGWRRNENTGCWKLNCNKSSLTCRERYSVWFKQYLFNDKWETIQSILLILLVNNISVQCYFCNCDGDIVNNIIHLLKFWTNQLCHV